MLPSRVPEAVAQSALRSLAPSAPSVRTLATPRADDALAGVLARAVELRAQPPPAHAVLARTPVPSPVRLPGPVLMRNGDGEDQEKEGWGAWARRQAKNPWVWAGIGLGCTVAGLVYLNRDSISESLTKEAIKHPELLSTGAKLMGKDYVADKVGKIIVGTMGDLAQGSSISGLTPSEHLGDVVDALAKTIPGGGLANAGLKVAQKIAEDQELVSTGLQVAQNLGPQFVFDVVKKVAVDHGGDIALHGIEMTGRPLVESAYFVYNKIGSNYW